MNKNKIKVLVFPAGTEHGIEIWKSLKDCKEIELFGATLKGVNHSEYIYSNCYYISSIFEDNWLNELQTLISKLNIDFIYPANSFVIDALISKRDIIKCKIALPDSKLVKITRSKLSTIKALNEIIPTPKIYQSESEEIEFPVFLKPINGYGSQNSFQINSYDSLNQFFLKHNKNDYLIQENLPGKEYTIDCLSDNNNILYCSPRTRERIRMGTSMHSELLSGKIKDELVKYAKNIFSILPITGAWFFQVKEDKNGILKLLEVEIRIAGTMVLNRVKGINFPLLSLYIFNNQEINTITNDYNINIDRCLLNRYSHNLKYNKVFVDLDDTIIVKNKINIDVIRFLYQCVNKKIKIILISKNLEKAPNEYLKKFRIYELFDEIIWLKEEDKKCDEILKMGYVNAIFIDDSFSTRLEVKSKLNIPTFDCSMIEMLIDERI